MGDLHNKKEKENGLPPHVSHQRKPSPSGGDNGRAMSSTSGTMRYLESTLKMNWGKPQLHLNCTDRVHAVRLFQKHGSASQSRSIIFSSRSARIMQVRAQFRDFSKSFAKLQPISAKLPFSKLLHWLSQSFATTLRGWSKLTFQTRALDMSDGG